MDKRLEHLMPSHYVITTSGLTKVYKGKRAVDMLDMHVAAGNIYGFVGKNGSGKSTTMKMICGLVTPTYGAVELFGSVTSAGAGTGAGMGAASPFSAAFSRVGTLIEEPGILARHSAFDNMMAKALALGVVEPEEECRRLLGLVGLDATDCKRTKGYSLGMKQRLGIALALVGGPDLLLLDEPFNGLDPEATRDVRAALMRLNQERGVTIVVSSHVLDQLDRMATRYGVIRDGRMVREFSEDELHERCGSSVRVRTTDPARALTALEEALPGAVVRVEPDDSIVIAAGGGDRHAAARFGGAAGDAAAGGAPTVEQVSRALHDADQMVLELTRQERDIEDYFVELMGPDDAA